MIVVCRRIHRQEETAVNMATVIALIAIAAILGLAIRYIYKEKKKGTKCIGCPYADSCPSKQFDYESGEYRCGHGK